METIENTKSKQIIKCDFSTISTHGLKNHLKRKRKVKDNKDDDFTKTCDLCETELDDYQEMIMHMKYHSYKQVEYKCEECEYCCKNEPRMEVYIGRAYSESGLCDLMAGDNEKLETHCLHVKFMNVKFVKSNTTH